MSANNFSYIPGSIEGYDFPLENFIPPLPKGTFPSWVEKMGLSNNLLIDPISANPLLSVELAASGYRVLCARSNPIIWLLTEVAGSAPTKEDFSTVLNKLFNTRHENTNLFDHLQGIYITPCANCGKMIQPDGYVWEKGKKQPTSRVYHCQFCTDEGEKDISDFDLKNLSRLGNLGIHRSRAFQRVVSGGDYEQASLNTALDCYLPRALYVCMLLANRLERLSLQKDQAKYIRASLLSVFNDAHSLKHWPPRNHHFLQLSVPTKFFERNLFLSLQSVHQQWKHINTPVKISYWPNLPDKEGGICFYQRGLTRKNQLIPDNTPAAITTIFPRPGQAFWTLSALWAGWLWGRKAVIPMRSALGRRRYDWYWFTKAVHTAFNRIASSLQENILVLGILPHYTPNLAFGLFTGLHTAGFDLEGSAFRISDELLQCQWKKRPDSKIITRPEINLRNIIDHFFVTRGEPAEYHRIIMQAAIEIARENGLPVNLSEVKESDFSRLQNLIKQLIAETDFLMPFSTDLPGGSRWWLLNEIKTETPISERIESAVREILLSRKGIRLADLDREICEKFRGERTPEFELINTILQSYMSPKLNDPHVFDFHSNESNDDREKDLKEIRDLLIRIGKSFNMQPTVNSSISWKDPVSMKSSYIFYPTISAEISQFLFKQDPSEKIQQVIVFPGSRSTLIYYRLQHDPRFASAVENGWHFLKFRHLRRLAEKDDLDIHSWAELLDNDPPLRTPPTQYKFL